jgi:NADH-quinone oxidoreductase subunit M
VNKLQDYLLFQAVLVPIILSPVAYLLGLKYGSKSAWFTFAVLLYSTLILLFAASQSNPYLEQYSFFPQALSGSPLLTSIGTVGFVVDGISIPFAATIYILCTAVALYSVPYMKHRIFEQEGLKVDAATSSSQTQQSMQSEAVMPNRSGAATLSETDSSHSASEQEPSENQRTNARFALYFTLYLLYSAGMLGTVLSTNLIELYFFFEFMLIPSYFLIAEFGYGARGRISLMYLLWTHIGALLMLLGFLTIGTITSTFVFYPINPASPSLLSGATALIPWIVFAIVVGLFVKLAAPPLHVWLPYAHAEAPTPISALLSPAMIGIAGYIVIRIMTLLLPNAYQDVGMGIAVWGLITMYYGGLMALAQDDIKRLFAYSSISQMGYIIFGIGTATSIGVSGSVFQFVSHGTSKAVLFMIAGLIIVRAGGLRSIKQMGGLSTKLPICAVCATIAFLGLLGFPETNGFQSEWLIFAGGLQRGALGGSTAQIWLVISILAVLSTALTSTYALWTMKRVFFGKLPENLSKVTERSGYMLAPIIFLAALTILLGVFPSLIDGPLFHTISSLPPPGLP